jgi:hypothetical protein
MSLNDSVVRKIGPDDGNPPNVGTSADYYLRAYGQVVIPAVVSVDGRYCILHPTWINNTRSTWIFQRLACPAPSHCKIFRCFLTAESCLLSVQSTISSKGTKTAGEDSMKFGQKLKLPLAPKHQEDILVSGAEGSALGRLGKLLNMGSAQPNLAQTPWRFLLHFLLLL